METPTLERPPEAPEETPEDNPSTPEPDGPNQPQDNPPAQADDELSIEGDDGYLDTQAGGKAPTSSKLQITGRSVEIEGQFAKGKRITAMVELVIGDVKFADQTDSETGQVVACTRTHYARIAGFAKK